MLARFERIMEQTLEGGLRRVFPAHLQPVQLAKAVARAMEQSQVVGLRGPEVPNVYVLRLAPGDMQRFTDYRATLARELGRYLADYARDRGLHPVAPPRVDLNEDARVRAGTVRVDARFVDIEPERKAVLDEALEGTRHVRVGAISSAAPRAPTSSGQAWLEDLSGRRYPLDPGDGVVRLGRALDNDVVLPDLSVSRYHAQMRWQGGGWVISDLESTNGTFIADEKVGANPQPVLTTSVLRLGGQKLRFRIEGASDG
jgi:Protein of unknown function (DUF3662)/FHA domain